MMKIFDKLNRIMFIAGMAALAVLVLIVANSGSDTIEGFWGGVSLICLLIIFVFCIFAVISVILGVIQGVKTDKVAFLKKFACNCVGIAVVYIVVFVLDYFVEAELPFEFDLGSMILRILVCALAIIGGEYMITDHSKAKKDELHF